MAQVIPYTDSGFNYLGRWFTADTGKQSGWQGSQVTFRVSGTASFTIACDIVDTGGANQAFAIINIDKGDAVVAELTTLGEAFTGEKTHEFVLPDTGEHTIIIKPAMWPTPQWDATNEKNIFKSITIDDGGTLSAWDRGPTIAGCVGDSWMATTNDWPMLLSDRYDIRPMSYGGATASDLDSRIDFMYSGEPVTGDPVMDIIFVNSAVNDYLSSVPTATYEASLTSDINKLRVQQPTATIFIIGSSDNTGAGKIYSQYNGNMANVADAVENCYYVSPPGNSELTWKNEAHIDYASRQVTADSNDAAVISRLGYQVQAGDTKPWIAANRLAGSRIATEYDGLTPYSFNKLGTEPVGIATPGTSALYIG